ncbi:ribonuclease E/G, partial [Halomonas sp. SIMBA_159]
VSVDLADFVAAHGEPQVPLARGARLWIEATRALTAVDVDAGGGSPRAANAAAPEALARALRLRNIAGTIVVDLINRAGDWSTDLD